MFYLLALFTTAPAASPISVTRPHHFRTKNFVSTAYPTNPAESPIMANQKPLILSEESADDILYFARSGETDDLVSTLKLIIADPATPFSSEAEVLLAARDEYSGNNAVHMAAGNGHFGSFFFPSHPRLFPPSLFQLGELTSPNRNDKTHSLFSPQTRIRHSTTTSSNCT